MQRTAGVSWLARRWRASRTRAVVACCSAAPAAPAAAAPAGGHPRQQLVHLAARLRHLLQQLQLAAGGHQLRPPAEVRLQGRLRGLHVRQRRTQLALRWEGGVGGRRRASGA